MVFVDDLTDFQDRPPHASGLTAGGASAAGVGAPTKRPPFLSTLNKPTGFMKKNAVA